MKGIILSITLALTLAQPSMASQIGLSVHPLESKSNHLMTEYTGRFSNGSSNGIQARYVHNYTSRLNFDGGFRVFKRDLSTLFASATYEFFPDFDSQPKISGKAFIERDRIGGKNTNNIGIAPIISKGYSFWGHPAYPYLSIPTRLTLIDKGDDYIFSTNLTVGTSAYLPFEGFTNVIGNIEASVNLKDSYSAISAGLSLNFQ